MSSSLESQANRKNAGSLLRWLALVAIAGVAIALIMSFVVRTIRVDSPVPAGEALTATQKADFRLPVLGGGEAGPPDYSGKVVVIDFWATWCGPCRLQAAFLESLHQAYDPAEVQFLAVNVGEDEKTVSAFVQSSPFPYPVLMDLHNALAQRYEVYGLPMVMIIDKAGTIVWKHVGVADRDALAKQIARAGAVMSSGDAV